MKKEVLAVFLVVLLGLVPFSSAQLNFIEIKDVNVNENSLQVLVQNNVNQDFIKETFIINNKYTIIQDEIFSNFTAKFFIVSYPGGIKLETIKVIAGDQSVDYVFSGNENIFVVNQVTSSITSTVESNSPISYIYSGQRLAKIQDNNIVYYFSDNIGSTSLQTDSSGNVNFKANYLPFGKELSFSSTNNEKYGFTGKEFDIESSLNYFNARYYNPSNGKFISNDPIFKPTEGGYQYVRNNPLTVTDPSGKNPLIFGLLAAGAAFGQQTLADPTLAMDLVDFENSESNFERGIILAGIVSPMSGHSLNKAVKSATKGPYNLFSKLAKYFGDVATKRTKTVVDIAGKEHESISWFGELSRDMGKTCESIASKCDPERTAKEIEASTDYTKKFFADKQKTVREAVQGAVHSRQVGQGFKFKGEELVIEFTELSQEGKVIRIEPSGGIFRPVTKAGVTTLKPLRPEEIKNLEKRGFYLPEVKYVEK